MAVPSLVAFRLAQSFNLKKSDSSKLLITNSEFPSEKEWEGDCTLAILMLDG